MQKEQSKKHMHVVRASSGFTLIELLVILTILGLFISLIHASYNRDYIKVKAVSETFEFVFQKEVIIHNISYDGNGVAIWHQTEGTPMTVVEEIWADHYVKASADEVGFSDGFKKTGRPHKIQINGVVSTGERVALWYIYSIKTLENGRSFTEVSRVEVRPLPR